MIRLDPAAYAKLQAKNIASKRKPKLTGQEKEYAVFQTVHNPMSKSAKAAKHRKPLIMEYAPVANTKVPDKARKRSRRDPGQPKTKERDVLKGCIAVLDSHPAVALWWRQNTGAMRDGTRFVKFSFRGASDLMAVLKGGWFLAVECKATGKIASPEQSAFLDNVIDAGGYAVCVEDPQWLAGYLNILS